MKNLITYLSKKSLSLGNGSGMTRKRLGIDSGMTRFSLTSLICLCMLTIGSGNAWGGSPQEITPATSGWSTTAGEQTGTVGDITVSTTRGVYNTQMRVYSGETFTVECSAGNMSQIVFTTSTGNFTTSNVGTYTTSTKTWAGTATSVTFNNSAQVRVTKVTVTYSASASVSAPTFGVAAGTYSNNQSVTLSCATAGATIYYTSSTNGVAPADPTSSSTAYSSAITVNHDNTIIKAIAIKGGTNSTVASATYRLTCATPTFSPTAGEYVGTQSVTISSETSNANIYYTTNGSTPTTSSTLYSGAITVSSSQTIKALVTKSNYTNSAVGSAAYTITPAYTVTWKNQGSTVTTTNVASGSKPVFPDMSLQSGCGKYTYFYGWAEDVWSGEVSSPGTSSTIKVYKVASEMPNVSGDVTYHAVWSDTQGGYALVESNLGTSWAGDYLIAYSSTVFADGRVGGTGTGGIGKQYVKANPGDNLSGKVVNATWGDTYHVTLEEILDNNDDPTNTYLLKTQDGQYNYQTSNANGLTSTSTRATAANYPITVTFTSSSDVKLGLGGSAAGAVLRYNTSEYFRYYKDCGQNAVYLYKKGASGGKCVTNCCTELGTINNSLTLTQGGNSVTISGWTYNAGSTGTTESNIASYTVRMYKKNGASWDLVTGSTTGGAAGTEGTRTGIATNSKSVTFTGLVVESEYKFTIAAVGASGYCDIAETPITSINSTDVSSTPFKFRYSIYIDNGSGSGWAHHYITPTGNTDEGSIDIDLTAHITSYQFKIAGGFSGWWGQTGTSNIPASTKWTLDGSNNVKLNTGAGGSYTFTVDYSGTTNPGVTVTFPSANQDPGYIIYYDNSVLNWSNLYYRIGNNSNCSKVDAVLVTGTDKFYKFTTPDYDNMDAWHIANNYGWTGSNSIYKTKTGDGTAITNSISFQQYVVTEDITVIPTTTHSTGGDDQNNNCQFYTINTPTSGMLTHTATIGSHTHGTINLAYTDVSGTAQNKTATTAGLAHRTKITASATPATGYLLNTFTVTPSGESPQNITSGATDNHILAKDATFAATFTAKTYDLTLDPDGGSGSNQTVTATYDAAMPTTLKGGGAIVLPTREGYDFGGYYSAKNGGGTQYYTSAGASARTWNVDDAITLYAKWTIKSYTLTWNLDGGSITSAGTAAGSVVYGTALTAPTVEKEGYDFTGWSPAVPSTMPAANSTYTAQWSIKHYTVTWKSNGSNYGEPVDYTHGASLVLPTPNPSVPSGCSSKVFVGWTSDSEITTETSTVPTFISAGGAVTADATYRAVFADEDDDEVTYSYGWEADYSTDDWEVSNITRSNTAADVRTGSYGGHVQTGSGAYIKLKHQVSPTSISCYYTKTSTNTNSGSSFALEYWNDDGVGYWDGLAMGRTMNNVTQGTWYELSWSGDDKEDTYVRVVYSGTNAPRALDDLVIVAGGVTHDNYITVCSSCTTPSSLAMSAITSTGGKVSWSGVSLSPTEGYKVAWNTSNSVPSPLNSGNSADVDADKSEYTISGLTPATQYYVFVQSKCNSTWSSSTNFHTNAKITYAANGGSGSMDPKEVTYNTNVTVDACTFTAPSGKKFNGWVSDQAVTVGGGSTTSVPDGATITSLTKAITLTAQWRDLASYTVNFSANNGTVAGGTSTTVYEDGTLTFPNVTSTTCGTFQGWVEAAYDSPTKPSGATFHEAGDEIDVVAEMDDKTYYAVYAEVTDPAPTSDYVKVECEQTDWEGDYLIVSEYTISSTDYVKVFNGGLETLDASGNCVADVTITSKTITSNNTTDGYKFTISAVAGQAGKFYIKSVGYSKYIGNSGTGNALSSSTEASSTYYNTIEYDATNSRVLIKGNNATPTRLAYNSATGASNNRFRYYSAPDSQKDIQLYKKGGAETVNYNTSPSCSPTVALTCSFSTFTYVYNAGPSASQTFMVSGSNLGVNTMTVTAPTNYEVSKDNSTFSSSVSYTPSDGSVAASTVYIRLAAGLSVGTYNYAQASGLVVACAGAGATAQKAALNGSVTKATGAIAFTDFNAVDHYEAELTGSSVDVTLTVSVTGDGSVSYTRSPAAGSSAVPATTPTTTLHTTTTGTWTVTATLTAGTNYTGSSTSCQVIVYKADRFYDNVHGNDMILKRNDTGEDHYTIPSLSDESRLLSGSCSETHYHFMGWVPESALSSLPNDAAYDAVMITGGGTQSATGTNYYAVWAEE